MLFKVGEATAARRRFDVYLVDATDGITPETGEAGGQPQISKNGGAWANTTATLTAVGNGGYYVELTAAELDTAGKIKVRYKSAETAEFQMPADVVAIDPFDAVRAGMTALPNANAEAAGGLYTRGAGAGQINQPSNGTVDANVTLWRGSQPAALSINSGLVQTMLMRVLTDNGAGTPSALSGGSFPANVDRWRGLVPALMDGAHIQVSVQAIAAAVVTSIQSGLALEATLTTMTATIATILAAVDTEVAAIKAKTDNLPASPAATGDIPSAATNASTLLATVLEGLETVADALRIMTAVKAGDATGLPASAEGDLEFLSKDGSKTRVAGSVSGGTRTITTRDGT